jgi:chromosome transmission fidelity protein 1
MDPDTQGKILRAVALGSRKQLCINDDLRKRTGDLDEACRTLLHGRSIEFYVRFTKKLMDCIEKGDKRCPHLPPIEENEKLHELRDQILV